MPDLVVGDGGTQVHATITDQDGERLDLSSKTVNLHFAIAGGVVKDRIMIQLDQNTSKGEAIYQMVSADLDVAGELEAEIVLNDTFVDRLTTEKFRVEVRDRLA